MWLSAASENAFGDRLAARRFVFFLRVLEPPVFAARRLFDGGGLHGRLADGPNSHANVLARAQSCE